MERPYHHVRPARGRDEVHPLNTLPKKLEADHPRAGVPLGSLADTPIQAIRTDDGEHIDTERALNFLAQKTKDIEAKIAEGSRVAQASQSSSVDVFEQRIVRAQRWGGWVWGLVSILALVFGAGAWWVRFVGTSATDDEVDDAITDAIIEHNDFIDPRSTDPTTHRPIGHHPELRLELDLHRKTLAQLESNTKAANEARARQLLLTRYQYAVVQWQALVTEAQRKREPAPKKPKEVEDLENLLLFGQE